MSHQKYWVAGIARVGSLNGSQKDETADEETQEESEPKNKKLHMWKDENGMIHISDRPNQE